jgi:hypothetical protein
MVRGLFAKQVSGNRHVSSSLAASAICRGIGATGKPRVSKTCILGSNPSSPAIKYICAYQYLR